ncbi:hypothetical protein [Hymenobacter algoricola]|uniref:Uncharacterized protein n=1 Tax=Hymenobacter algoricola TaxID=486267 RepID=A0ABP7NTT6_9BACT
MSLHEELLILPVLSNKHDQTIELTPHQAEALLHALKWYLRFQIMKATHNGPLYPSEAQTIRPVHQVLKRLSKLRQDSWPRDRMQRPKLRKFRLEFDAVLLLNGLLREDELTAAETMHRGPLNAVYLQINQKAQNLTQFFQL